MREFGETAFVGDDHLLPQADELTGSRRRFAVAGVAELHGDVDLPHESEQLVVVGRVVHLHAGKRVDARAAAVAGRSPAGDHEPCRPPPCEQRDALRHAVEPLAVARDPKAADPQGLGSRCPCAVLPVIASRGRALRRLDGQQRHVDRPTVRKRSDRTAHKVSTGRRVDDQAVEFGMFGKKPQAAADVGQPADRPPDPRSCVFRRLGCGQHEVVGTQPVQKGNREIGLVQIGESPCPAGAARPHQRLEHLDVVRRVAEHVDHRRVRAAVEGRPQHLHRQHATRGPKPVRCRDRRPWVGVEEVGPPGGRLQVADGVGGDGRLGGGQCRHDGQPPGPVPPPRNVVEMTHYLRRSPRPSEVGEQVAAEGE